MRGATVDQENSDERLSEIAFGTRRVTRIRKEGDNSKRAKIRGDRAVVRWTDFETTIPELGVLLRQRFESTDLVMLGTMRKDGWPRITPIEYTIFEGDFVIGGMWQSKKMLDLLRDPRCSIHSTTTNKDGQEGDAKLFGRARTYDAATEERYWQHIYETMQFRPNGPAHVFAIDIDSAAYVRFTGEGTMNWLTWPGGEWRTKASGG